MDAGLRVVWGWGQSGDGMVAKWEHLHMMKLIHSCLSFAPIPAPFSSPTLSRGFGHAFLLCCLANDRMVCKTPGMDASSEARHGYRWLTGVSGQRPEQGADAKFFATQKTWAQGPYPAQ